MDFKKVAMIAAIGFLAIQIGCKSKDDDPKKSKGDSTGELSDADKANLYDKVWYAQASGGGIDQEFLSDGEYRQAKSLSGSWEWLNKGDTMSLVDYNNKKFKYVFDEITSTTMKYRTNLGGDNFKNQVVYGTTK